MSLKKCSNFEKLVSFRQKFGERFTSTKRKFAFIQRDLREKQIQRMSLIIIEWTITCLSTTLSHSLLLLLFFTIVSQARVISLHACMLIPRKEKGEKYNLQVRLKWGCYVSILKVGNICTGFSHLIAIVKDQSVAIHEVPCLINSVEDDKGFIRPWFLRVVEGPTCYWTVHEKSLHEVIILVLRHTMGWAINDDHKEIGKKKWWVILKSGKMSIFSCHAISESQTRGKLN